MNKVLVTAAVRQELSVLETALEDAEPLPAAGGCYLRGVLDGVEVFLGLTGIGPERARRKIELLLDGENPGLLLAVGFGGGLTGTIRSGDVILAERVIEASSEGQEPRELNTDEALIDSLGAISLSPAAVHRGSLLTVPGVVCSAKGKRALGSRYGAEGVDMESFVILREALGRAVPCILARAVLDEAGFDLPRGLERIPGPDGKPRAIGLVALLLCRPWAVCRLFSLRAKSARASAGLADFVRAAIRTQTGSRQDD